MPFGRLSGEVEAEGEEKRLAVKRWKLGGLALQAMVRLRELVEPRRVSAELENQCCSRVFRWRSVGKSHEKAMKS